MLLSIIIPVYNREDLIIKCLDSIPDRTDTEIIVVDDNSTDRTLEVLNTYSQSRDNMIIYHHNKNLGPGMARNTGLEFAKGKYIMFVDSDDYIYPDVFNYIMNTIISEEDSDIIFVKRERNDGYSWISPWSLQGCFVKRSFIGDTRHNNAQTGEDSNFLQKLANKNPHVNRLNYVLYHYNLNVNEDGSVDGIEGSQTWKRKRGLL